MVTYLTFSFKMIISSCEHYHRFCNLLTVLVLPECFCPLEYFLVLFYSPIVMVLLET